MIVRNLCVKLYELNRDLILIIESYYKLEYLKDYIVNVGLYYKRNDTCIYTKLKGREESEMMILEVVVGHS